jgi:Cu/Ag efflux pump CusA
MPQVMVRLRPYDIAGWGFDSVQVLDVIRTAFGGYQVSEVYNGNQVFPVSVILNPVERRNYVPLGQLADVYESSGRYMISHIGARRVQSVTCNVTSGNVAGFVTTARQRISRLAMPAGTYGHSE